MNRVLLRMMTAAAVALIVLPATPGSALAADPGPPPLSACTLIGTENDDVLVGSSGDDVICGLGGDDVLLGEEGNDILIGGAGDDILVGGWGRDRSYGEDGSDEIVDTREAGVQNGGAGTDDRCVGVNGTEFSGCESIRVLRVGPG